MGKIFIVLAVLLLPIFAAEAQIYRFRSGLHLSRERPLSKKEQLLLERDLRTATGLEDLKFDQQGTLNPGGKELTTASTVARKLIEAVVVSDDSFTIESVPDSTSIAFAQIEATADYFDAAGKKHQAWNIRIDFADFKKLRGSEEVLRSFSPAMVLFHELGHGQLRLRDPVNALDPLGECETFVNQIRAELGLPLRMIYVPKGRFPFPTEFTARGEQAEFRFSTVTNSKTHYLSFDLFSVCAGCRTHKLSVDHIDGLVGRK
jgi:hypothetical protein